MKTFIDVELADGVKYFCVHKGIVHYLTARLTSGPYFYTFFYEDVHGDIVEFFDAYECDLIYQV